MPVGHQSKFKNVNKHEDMRRRRTETSVELRKQKKEEQLMKRRNIDVECLQDEEIVGTDVERKPVEGELDMLTLDQCLAILRNDRKNEEMLLQAVNSVRRHLSRAKNPPIDLIINKGFIPFLVQSLGVLNEKIKFEACWALTNIASGTSEHTMKVVEFGIVPPVIELLDSSNLDLVEQAAWCLGNINAQTDAAWTLSYVSDGDEERIAVVIESGVIPMLVQTLLSDKPGLVAPALRTLGNIVTGSDSQTQTVIDGGILSVIPFIFDHEKAHLQKEAFWLMSNIVAGTSDQIQAVIQAGILPLIIKKLETAEMRGRIECAWTLTNLVTGGTDEQIAFLLSLGVIGPMCNSLSVNDPRLINVLLDGLAKIFDMAVRVNQLEHVCLAVEECGGLDKLEDLQNNDNDEIYQKAFSLIENHFTDSSEEVDANIAAANGLDNVVVPEGGFNIA